MLMTSMTSSTLNKTLAYSFCRWKRQAARNPG